MDADELSALGDLQSFMLRHLLLSECSTFDQAVLHRSERHDDRQLALRVQCLVGLAHAHFFMQEREAAHSDLAQLVALEPDSGRAAFIAGEVLLAHGDAKEALVYLRRAAQVKDAPTQALCRLAEATAAEGRTDAAKDLMQKVIDREPLVAEYHFRLVQILTVQLQDDADQGVNQAILKSAINACRRAIALGEGELVSAAQGDLAMMLLFKADGSEGAARTREVTEANKLLQAIQKDRKMGSAYFVHLAHSLQETGCALEAKEVLETGKRTFPNDPHISHLLAVTHFNHADYRLCLSALQSIKAGQDVNIDLLRGESLRRLDRLQEAERCFADALDLANRSHPEHRAVVSFFYGVFLMQHRSAEAAKPHIEAAVLDRQDSQTYKACLESLNHRLEVRRQLSVHAKDLQAHAQRFEVDRNTEIERLRIFTENADQQVRYAVSTANQLLHLEQMQCNMQVRQLIARKAAVTGGVFALKMGISIFSTLCGCPVILI